MSKKPLASLSLDLDNQWSYMKTHGDEGWESYPSYLDIVVPRALDFLAERQLKITFFVVGQDAAREENASALKMIADAGHEIGNHSFNHEPWLHLYTQEEIEDELARTEDAIHAVTGKRPNGFRGPGYSLSEDVLKVLVRRNYAYDCSTFPTFLGPIARAYYFMTTRLSDEEKAQRKKLFGTMQEGFRPNKPYMWDSPDINMLEIPVTTMPLFKIPIHASYILFLARFSSGLAMLYFRIALMLCRLTGVEPSILLHPLDFMTVDDVPELGFFPAMQDSLDNKLDIMSRIMTLLTNRYDVLPMGAYAAQRKHKQELPTIVPQFNT
ncbi:MAG: polysaccharide deacetylase family protein [Aggregatilineales bacterium]